MAKKTNLAVTTAAAVCLSPAIYLLAFYGSFELSPDSVEDPA